MGDRKLWLGFPLTHIIVIVMGVLIIYLTVDFGRQVITSQRRREELRVVEGKLEAVEARHSVLLELLAWAQSNQAAEAWARTQGWAKPNEVPVVIVAPTAAPSPGEEIAPATYEDLSANSEAWWDLFFGDR